MAATNESEVYIVPGFVRIFSRKRAKVPFDDIRLIWDWDRTQGLGDLPRGKTLDLLNELPDKQYVYTMRRQPRPGKTGLDSPMWIQANGDGTFRVYDKDPLAAPSLNEDGLTGRVFVIATKLKAYEEAKSGRGRYFGTGVQPYWFPTLTKGDITRYVYTYGGDIRESDLVYDGEGRKFEDKALYIEFHREYAHEVEELVEEAFAYEQLNKMTVVELRKLLKDRGLKASGRKADLIDRLMG